MDKPEALRLADEWRRKTQNEAGRRNSACDHYGMDNTPENVDPLGAKMAAELRRLSAENELLGSAADKLRLAWRDEVQALIKEKDELIAQRDALLKVVQIVDAHYSGSLDYRPSYVRLARAAISAVEGDKT